MDAQALSVHRTALCVPTAKRTSNRTVQGIRLYGQYSNVANDLWAGSLYTDWMRVTLSRGNKIHRVPRTVRYSATFQLDVPLPSCIRVCSYLLSTVVSFIVVIVENVKSTRCTATALVFLA